MIFAKFANVRTLQSFPPYGTFIPFQLYKNPARVSFDCVSLFYDYLKHYTNVFKIFRLVKSPDFSIFLFLLLLLLYQACGLHNQVMTQRQLLKDKFDYFTSLTNDDSSHESQYPAYGSVTKINIMFKTYKIHDKYMQA